MTKPTAARFVSLSDLRRGSCYLNLSWQSGTGASIELTREQVLYINSRTAHVIIKDDEERERNAAVG